MNFEATTRRHGAAEAAIDAGGGAGAADFVRLLKPRVMSLVLFTAFVGLMLAPGPIHPVIAATALLCIAVGAGPPDQTKGVPDESEGNGQASDGYR